MAKITAVFPTFVKDEVSGVDNQAQLIEALDTQKNELNFGYQKDLKDEQARLEWFFS